MLSHAELRKETGLHFQVGGEVIRATGPIYDVARTSIKEPGGFVSGHPGEAELPRATFLNLINWKEKR